MNCIKFLIILVFILLGPVHAMAATSTLFVDANGNVGIGTTVPGARLHVGGGTPDAMLITGSDLFVRGNLEIDGKLYGDGTGLIAFTPGQWTTSGNNIYYNLGNVGIGTVSPVSPFEVANYIYLNGTDANTKVGFESGKNIVSGAAYNTFLGYRAGASAVSSTDAADSNTAIGYNAFFANTTGSGNSAGGANALYANTTGVQNTAIGNNALYQNTTGSNNTAAGQGALYSNQAGSNGTALGTSAMYYTNNTNVDFNIYSVAVGYEALRGSTTATANTGNYNTATGYQSLIVATTGSENAAHGHMGIYSNTVGSRNVAIGTSAMERNVAGSGGTAVGYQSMRHITSTTTPFENCNVAVGHNALRFSWSYASNTGNYNTMVGHTAGLGVSSGSHNTMVGSRAYWTNWSGQNNSGSGLAVIGFSTTAEGNTLFGFNALLGLTTGSNNIAIGGAAGRFHSNGTTDLAHPENSIYISNSARGFDDNDANSIVLGYEAISLGANRVVLGNGSVVTTALRGDVGIGTTAPQQKLEVRGGAMLGTEYAVTAAGTMTVNWLNGNQQYVTLNQLGHVINFSNAKAGQFLRLFLCQDSTGSRTVTTWGSSVVWAGGSAPVLTTTGLQCDIVTFVCTNAKGSLKTFAAVASNF